MRSFPSLEAYADARAEGFALRAPARIAGLLWRPHPGHAAVEYEFDERIGYSVPAREVRHGGCVADQAGRVYCPQCRDYVPRHP